MTSTYNPTELQTDIPENHFWYALRTFNCQEQKVSLFLTAKDCIHFIPMAIIQSKAKEGEEEVKEVVQVVKKKNNKVWLIVLLVVGALLIIGLSGFFIFKKKKNNKDKDLKNNKNKKENKLKKAFIEEETEELETKEVIEEEKPKIKPSVDEALEDLMKTKEIELNNL